MRAATAVGWICAGYTDRGDCGQLSCVGGHSESNRIPREHYESEVGSQSSDSQAWERRGAEVVIGRREPEAECEKSINWENVLLTMWPGGEVAGSRERDGAPTGGPACGLDRSDLTDPMDRTECTIKAGNWGRVRETSEGPRGGVSLSDL